jgi:hypothetical protein
MIKLNNTEIKESYTEQMQREAWEYCPRGRNELEDQGREGKNKFWSQNMFKPNPWQMIKMPAFLSLIHKAV